jgi:hypothetical protein
LILMILIRLRYLGILVCFEIVSFSF